MKGKFYIVILCIMLCISCDRWEETADVSHVSYLPEWVIPGGEYLSVAKGDRSFSIPAALAIVNGKTVQVSYISDSIDINTPGVYRITYYADNGEGLSSIKDVYLAVRKADITFNNLSGKYVSTTFGLAESKVTKLNDQGYYSCEEVFGFPGTEMKGIFVDIGDNSLVLLNGDGYFGRYGIDEGTYTNRTLSWDIRLLDDPYTGLVIPITWVKQ